jgi:hypothetical protein
MLLQAEPDPNRASLDKSFSAKSKLAALLAAKLNAANPEADADNPTPIGKLLLLATLAFNLIPAIFLTRSK